MTAWKRWGNLFRSPQRTACNHEEEEGLSQRNIKAFLGKKAGGFLFAGKNQIYIGLKI